MIYNYGIIGDEGCAKTARSAGTGQQVQGLQQMYRSTRPRHALRLFIIADAALADEFDKKTVHEKLACFAKKLPEHRALDRFFMWPCAWNFAIKGMGITYATSTMGADHTAGYSTATNILKVGGFVDPLKKEGQVELSRNLQIATALIDSTGLCLFVAFAVLDKPEAFNAIVDMVNAKYGTAITGDDGIGLGKSVLKLERAFNTEAGFTSVHDRLPEFFEELCPPHNAVWDFTGKEIDSFWDF